MGAVRWKKGPAVADVGLRNRGVFQWKTFALHRSGLSGGVQEPLIKLPLGLGMT